MSSQEEFMNTWEKEARARHEEMKKRVNKQAPKIARELRGMGVAKVEVTYDGAGDSGMIDGFDCFDSNDKDIDINSRNHPNPTNIKGVIESIFYDLLETRFPGWEINDGSFGKYTWNLENNDLTHEHNERVTSSELHKHEGW